MLLKIAWRNIWRHKTRSAVIICSVIFGLWSGLFIQSYMNGIIDERIRTAIEKEISHLQVHHPGFKKDFNVALFIPDGLKILENISAMPEVKAVSSRLIAKGMISTASGNTGIKINGIDAVKEDSLTHLSRNIIEGNYFLPAVKNEIIVGQKLQKKLKLKLNSKIVLTLLDKEGNLTSGAFRVKGIFKTQNSPYDESNVFMEESDLALMLNARNEFHEIAVLLYSNESLDLVNQRISLLYPHAKTETWKSISPEMELIVSTAGQSLLIYMSIIMLALAFGIINTMLMAVLERTREIGMLMALGMNRIRIFMMILVETFFLVFIGTPVGMFLGFVTTWYFGVNGINMSAYKAVYESFGYSEIIFPKLYPNDYFIVLKLVILTSIVSAVFPARKALSLNPSEAIRK